ncbi:MAG: hypothetical protein ACM3IJ_03000 [Candidatus Levyibacteriota bacterium]
MRRYSFLLTPLFFLFFSSIVYASSISTSANIKQITAETEIPVQTDLSINSQEGTNYFLRGVFFKPGTNDYCGYTWNGSSFFSGPYSGNSAWKNFYLASVANSSWSGTLKVKIDPVDSGCSTSGTYSFKVQRFTNSGSATFDSQNELSFEVTVPTPTSTTAPTPTQMKVTPTKIPMPTTYKPSKINSPTPLKPSSNLVEPPLVSSLSATEKALSVSSISSQIKGELPTPVKEEIAGISEKKNNGAWILFLGFGILATACGILLFQKYRNGIKKQEA